MFHGQMDEVVPVIFSKSLKIFQNADRKLFVIKGRSQPVKSKNTSKNSR